MLQHFLSIDDALHLITKTTKLIAARVFAGNCALILASSLGYPTVPKLKIMVSGLGQG